MSCEISKEILEEILCAGMAAPSVKNRQPWKCIVLGRQFKEGLPVLIVVLNTNGKSPFEKIDAYEE